MTGPRAAAAALTFLMLAGSAGAHSPGTSQVHPLLDALPADLSPVTVQVAETLAPQLLVENHGSQTLEILDDHGRAFIRIGPDGVSADLAAAAWYDTIATAGVQVPEAARDPAAPAHWVKVQKDPAFGWFDPRLNVARAHVGPADAHASHPVLVGAWSVPVLWDGKPASIAGHFQFRPMPRGAYEATLTSPEGLPAGIALRVIQGGTPAILLENRGNAAVTVLGLEGEPYIRLGPEGAEVNTGSPTWRQYGREHRAGEEDTSPASGPPHWLHVSTAPSYSWLEPRATVPAEASDGPTHPDRHWQIPIEVGTRAMTLEGASVWVGAAHQEAAR